MASQSLLTKWQNMVDDHRAYEEKLAETEAWLKETPANEQADQGRWGVVFHNCGFTTCIYFGCKATFDGMVVALGMLCDVAQLAV